MDHILVQSPRTARIASVLLGSLLLAWSLVDDPFVGGGPDFGWTQRIILAAGIFFFLSAGFGSREWNWSVLALFLSTAATLLVAEIILRGFFAARYYPPFQLDEEYLYRLTPGAAREYVHTAENGGRRIVYKVNSDGYRGEELVEKSARRIVVYGDSFIHAEFSALENTFPEQLEKNLTDKLELDIEAVNAGVAGYGPDQILKRLPAELTDLNPDLLVVSVYAGNDFGDLIRNKLFRVGESGLTPNPFSLDPEIVRNFQVGPQESIIKKMLRKVRDGSATEERIQPDVSIKLEEYEREYEEYVIRKDNVVRELLVDGYSVNITLTPDSPSARYQRSLMDGVLAGVKTIAEDFGVPLVLMFIPHPTDVAHGMHISRTIDIARYPNYNPRILTDLLEESASRHGIEFLNLYSYFEDAGTDELYLRGGDDHWNDRGQEYAAELMADYLIDSGILSEW